jgi:hypothetical protein
MSSTLVLNALRESQLKNTLNDQVINPFGIYDLAKFGNSFNLFRDTLRATPKNTISGSVFSKALRFQIDRYATLSSMAIKTTLSVVSSATMGTSSNDRFGAKLFSQIEFKCLGRTIQTNYPLSILQQINDSDVEIMNKYVNATSVVMPTSATTQEIIVYTPLFWFFDQDKDYWLDFSFLEQCEIHCTFNSQAALFKSASSGLTSLSYTDSELVTNFIVLPQDIQDEVNQKNLNSPEPYSAVGFDFHKESVATATYSSGSTYTFTLPSSTNKHITMDTVFRCRNANTNLELPISRLQVSASGKTIVDVYQDEAVLNDGRLGIHLGSTTLTTSLYYGIAKDKYTPGNFPAADLNNVVYTVTVDTSSGASGSDVLEMHYGHSYNKMVTINGGSGVLDTGIST